MTTLDRASAEQVSVHEQRQLLDVEHLTIRSGRGTGQVLVQDASLRLRQGETLGIVGESGSGKSLTARALMRLLPTGLTATGRVTLQGQSLLDASERELRRLRGTRISLLLQDPFGMLNPLQTIYTHIVESLPNNKQRSRNATRVEVERRLREVGLGPSVMRRYPFQLSGGMRQRAALAAALAKDPELLIADEPTTALDVTTQAEVLGLLKELQQQRGMGLILITHDLRLAFSVCDTIQVMYAGSVVERASAAQLARHPGHPYSLGLLQSELPTSHYVERIPSIPGQVPRAEAVADRCAFSERCSWADERCVKSRPSLSPAGPNQWSACVRIREIDGQILTQLRQRVTLDCTPRAERSIADPVVAVHQLRKSYSLASSFTRSRREIPALNEVSLAVHEGESVGLVGETGSGKTTIARCILGLTQADSGRIEIAGMDTTDHRRLTRKQRELIRTSVQVVFQDPYASLNPAYTVGATLHEALELRTSRGSAPTVAALLDSVGLPVAYASRRPAALSGGERQRVAIARALALRPRLLICDEPVASLDVSAQAQILELLRQIRRERGMSMLFITHDLSVVRQMTERVIVLYRGSIVERGPVDAVLGRPADPYTRRLVDAIPHAVRKGD